MSLRSKGDITRWPIFWRADPDTVSRIKYACVFGQSTEALFITVDDEVYGIGTNMNGCLGIGDVGRLQEPAKLDVLTGKKIISIATGHHPHVLAVTADGELYAWGDNSYGQLGIGSHSLILVPQICQSMDRYKVKQVACGAEHSVALVEDHEVFAWGSNDHSQVLPDRSYSTVTSPVKVMDLPNTRPVEDIVCSAYASFALTAGGQLYGWGYNGNGELGIDTFESRSTPQRVGAHLDLVFQSIACGHMHVVALSHEGQVYAWGHNYYGQVGISSAENIPSPTPVDVDDLIFVEVGANHNTHISAATTHSGRVLAWGQFKDGAERKPILTSFSSIHDVFATLACPAVTYKPLTPLNGREEDTPIRTCLRLHLDNEEVSDVKFIVSDKALFAHGSFLRMRSQYFRAMLSSNWDDREKREFRVQGYSYNVYRAYLEYLYTEKLTIDADDAMDLLQLSDEYCEPELKQMCENFILSAVTVDNVFSLYAASKRLSAKRLEDFCFNFAIAHLNCATQTESYRLLDDGIAKEFFRIAGKRNAFRN